MRRAPATLPMTSSSRHHRSPAHACRLPYTILCVFLFVCASLPLVRGSIFGGPSIDGDTYVYDGDGDEFDPKDAFSDDDDDELTDITLSNWDMSSIGNLSIPRSVKKLTLLHCKLDSIPEEIITLPHLEKLNMASNHLTSFNANFSAASQIKELNVSKNNITEFGSILSSLQILDMSSNSLAAVPPVVITFSALTSLFLNDNDFKLVTVTDAEFDFYAGLFAFRADFVDVIECAEGSTLVNLKGAQLCRLHRATTTPDDGDSTPSSTPVTGAPHSDTEQGRSGRKMRYVMYAMIAVLITMVIVGGVALFIRRRQLERLRGVLHEETPLYFDSAKRTKYQQEMVAGDKLFPSNDPVLVTWRIDYDAIKLVRRLAKGAYGEVWVGRYRGSRVAVKRLLGESVSFEASEEFIREIKLMAWLEHPKIVAFVGVAWTRLVDMLAVTEYMDKGDLRTLIEADRRLTWSTTKLQYAIDTIDAIVYLHSLNPVIVHRDLKSRNILVDSRKGAKLGDFGISSTKRDSEMTTGVGTTRWIAPELASGETTYTEAVDIYSFGVILSELDTHEIPFYNERTVGGEPLSDIAILQGVAKGTLAVRFSEQCPPKLREIGERCISTNPNERPSAAEVAYQLRQRDLLVAAPDDGIV